MRDRTVSTPAARMLRTGALAGVALASLTLAACARDWPSRADDISLGSRQLAVRFTDGAVCRADIQPEGGQGMFLNCPHPARFDVRVKKQNILASALGDVVSPYAVVTIYSEDGRSQVFRTPDTSAPGAEMRRD